jgi:hypothetical protein
MYVFADVVFFAWRSVSLSFLSLTSLSRGTWSIMYQVATPYQDLLARLAALAGLAGRQNF